MVRSMLGVTALAVLVAVCPCSAFAVDVDTGPQSDGSTTRAKPNLLETNQADESFEAGRALLKDKRYAEACPKFAESQRHDPASGTLLALAYCQELSGVLATSWANYVAAARLAEHDGQKDRQSAATERAQALAERLSRLTVVVPQELLSLPHFQVLLDGVELERASFGIPIPMDGGAHAFVATAPNRSPWSSTVTLSGERDNKTLVLPILDRVRPARPPSVGVVAPPLIEQSSSRSLKLASLALAAGSVIGLGLGTVFALRAESKNTESNAKGCNAQGCDGQGTALRNDALGFARTSTWAFVAGGALAAGSITLYLASNTSSKSNSNSGSTQSAPRIEGTFALGAPTVSVAGNF